MMNRCGNAARLGAPIWGCLIGIGCLIAAGCGGRAAFDRGEALAKAGDLDAAVRSYQSAADANPTNVEYRVRLLQAKEEAAYQREKEGEECLRRGDLDCAIQAFQRAVELDLSYEMAQERLHEARGLKRLREQESATPGTDAVDGPAREGAGTGPRH